MFLEPFGRQTERNPNEKICVWVRRHRQRGELVQLAEIEAAVILPRRPIHVVDVLSGVRYEREGVRALPTKLSHVARMEIKRRVSTPVHRFAILEKGGQPTLLLHRHLRKTGPVTILNGQGRGCTSKPALRAGQ